ncbi:hypothetical protein ACP70R_007859 [Stipagrostis hirtigluma subsp. patula]
MATGVEAVQVTREEMNQLEVDGYDMDVGKLMGCLEEEVGLSQILLVESSRIGVSRDEQQPVGRQQCACSSSIQAITARLSNYMCLPTSSSTSRPLPPMLLIKHTTESSALAAVEGSCSHFLVVSPCTTIAGMSTPTATSSAWLSPLKQLAREAIGRTWMRLLQFSLFSKSTLPFLLASHLRK